MAEDLKKEGTTLEIVSSGITIKVDNEILLNTSNFKREKQVSINGNSIAKTSKEKAINI